MFNYEPNEIDSNSPSQTLKTSSLYLSTPFRNLSQRREKQAEKANRDLPTSD
jgi:hypothetical protein